MWPNRPLNTECPVVAQVASIQSEGKFSMVFLDTHHIFFWGESLGDVGVGEPG